MNMEVKNIRVQVVDNDRSTQSQQLVHSIEASRYFVFGGQQPSYQAALKEMERSKADVVLVIKEGYGKFVEMAAAGHPLPLEGDGGRLLIAANAVNGTKGSMGGAYLSQIVTARQPILNSQFSILNLYNKHLNYKNKHLNYKVFMIPALLAVVMMLMCGFLPALNIVGEKESGTIEQINVTPVSKWSFILAKLIPYWLIALFAVTVCLLLSWAVYGITCQGPLWLVYVLAMLLALFFSSFGLIISNYSDTMQQAVFVMWFFIVCIMLLSGLFTPTRSMPSWAYATTYVNPMSYFIEAVRTVFVRGGTIMSVWRQILALGSISLLMSVLAVLSYKKNN